jgi:hypothetical protein
MAKARATFQISDILDSQKIKSKYNQIFWLGILVCIAQFLKLSAEHKFLDSMAENTESKIEHVLGIQKGRGPIVNSAHLDLDQITDERYS